MLEINPPVRTLPPVIFAVALINPPVRTLPAVMLPVTLDNPVVNIPVLATVNTLLVPAIVMPMLPLVAAAIFDVPAVTGKPEVLAVTPVN